MAEEYTRTSDKALFMRTATKFELTPLEADIYRKLIHKNVASLEEMPDSEASSLFRDTDKLYTLYKYDQANKRFDVYIAPDADKGAFTRIDRAKEIIAQIGELESTGMRIATKSREQNHLISGYIGQQRIWDITNSYDLRYRVPKSEGLHSYNQVRFPLKEETPGTQRRASYVDLDEKEIVYDAKLAPLMEKAQTFAADVAFMGTKMQLFAPDSAEPGLFALASEESDILYTALKTVPTPKRSLFKKSEPEREFNFVHYPVKRNDDYCTRKVFFDENGKLLYVADYKNATELVPPVYLDAAAAASRLKDIPQALKDKLGMTNAVAAHQNGEHALDRCETLSSSGDANDWIAFSNATSGTNIPKLGTLAWERSGPHSANSEIGKHVLYATSTTTRLFMKTTERHVVATADVGPDTAIIKYDSSIPAVADAMYRIVAEHSAREPVTTNPDQPGVIHETLSATELSLLQSRLENAPYFYTESAQDGGVTYYSDGITNTPAIAEQGWNRENGSKEFRIHLRDTPNHRNVLQSIKDEAQAIAASVNDKAPLYTAISLSDSEQDAFHTRLKNRYGNHSGRKHTDQHGREYVSYFQGPTLVATVCGYTTVLTQTVNDLRSHSEFAFLNDGRLPAQTIVEQPAYTPTRVIGNAGADETPPAADDTAPPAPPTAQPAAQPSGVKLTAGQWARFKGLDDNAYLNASAQKVSYRFKEDDKVGINGDTRWKIQRKTGRFGFYHEVAGVKCRDNSYDVTLKNNEDTLLNEALAAAQSNSAMPTPIEKKKKKGEQPKQPEQVDTSSAKPGNGNLAAGLIGTALAVGGIAVASAGSEEEKKRKWTDRFPGQEQAPEESKWTFAKVASVSVAVIGVVLGVDAISGGKGREWLMSQFSGGNAR